MEIWKAVPDYEGFYEASSLGRVRSLDRRSGQKFCRGVIISPSSDGAGYESFSARKVGKITRMKVHRAVCSAFHGAPPPKSDARHLNGDRSDNRAENLAWGSRRENMADMIAHGRTTRGERNARAILDETMVRAMRAMRAQGVLYRDIASEFGVSLKCAHGAVRGERWAHVQ